MLKVDCKGVVNKIKSSAVDKTELDHLTHGCRSLLIPPMILDLLRDKIIVMSYELVSVVSSFPSLYIIYHIIPCIEQFVINEI